MTAPIKVAHAFSGIDGFGLGFGRAFETTCHIEINKHARRVLKEHTHSNNIPIMEDISDVHGTDIGRPELACAGFPCQDTSIGAPHRRGLDGARSHKFFDFTRLVDEYARLVDSADPRWVVLENPTGLLKSRGGRDMATVVGTLVELGYGLAWRVVDGRHLGQTGGRTPQNRRRLIVVGHRGGDPRPAWQVLGDADSGSGAPVSSVDGLADARQPAGPFVAGGSVARVWRKGANPRVALRLHDHPTCPPPNANGKYPKHPCQGSFNPAYQETWLDDGTANTLAGHDGGLATRQKHLIAQHGRLRTLTLTEWERLQGFPDGWTAMIPEGERYTALANAIHVGTAAWLGRRLAVVHHALPQIQKAS